MTRWHNGTGQHLKSRHENHAFIPALSCFVFHFSNPLNRYSFTTFSTLLSKPFEQASPLPSHTTHLTDTSCLIRDFSSASEADPLLNRTRCLYFLEFALDLQHLEASPSKRP